ncbi:plasmid replication protein, CyRepA1 family [Acaryochloris marina NIES-2412]|uniref:plasmid replication protein, CyRepA1 family n=1 Tax=Acaryochloris marina TaxID=155978 RepID=UPI004059C4AA
MTSTTLNNLDSPHLGFGTSTRSTSKLTPFRGPNHCPICDSHDGRCRGGEEIVLCMSETQDIGTLNGYKFRKLSKNHLWGIWAPHTGDDFNAIDWKARKAIHDQKAVEERRQRIARELSPQLRNQQYRKLLSGLSLCSMDQGDLDRRGMSQAEIDGFDAVSVGQFQRVQDLSPDLPGVLPGGILNSQGGYLWPLYNVHGQIVALQLRKRNVQEGNRYSWLSSSTRRNPNGNGPHVNGEIPLAVYKSFGPYSRIALVEGTGVKPYLLSQRLHLPTIGAAGGLWASSPETLKETLEELSKAAEQSPIITLYPDAGAVRNLNVFRQYQRVIRLMEEWGYVVEVAWWGQNYKDSFDVDELTPVELAQIVFKPTWFFNSLGLEYELGQLFMKLNGLTDTPTTLINKQYIELSDLGTIDPGSVVAIASMCGTGKTEMLKSLVQGVKGQVIMPGYRNNLLYNTEERFTSKDAAGNTLYNLIHLFRLQKEYQGNISMGFRSERSILLCFDSLLKIDVDDIEPDSCIILDEADAALFHVLSGQTLGDRQNQILEHFHAIANRVLETRGNIILLEDSLSQIPIDYIKGITGGKYNTKIVVNEFQPTDNFPTKVFSGQTSQFLERILTAVADNERFIVVATSQEFLEKLERMIADVNPEFAKGILRHDRKTSERPENKIFQANPTQFVEDYQPTALFLSPTAESGVSIDEPRLIPYFSRVFCYASSNHARSVYQQLWRYRAKVTREIYVTRKAHIPDIPSIKSVEQCIMLQSKYGQDVAASIDLEQQLVHDQSPESAQQLAALKAYQQNPNNIHNVSFARYQTRSIASLLALRESLLVLLEGHGHPIELEELKERNSNVVEAFSKVRKQIEVETAVMLGTADGERFTVEQAIRIMGSSSATYKDTLDAKKSLLQDELPGVELTDEFIHQVCVEHRGRLKSATKLHWMSYHPEVAEELDRRNFMKQLNSQFVLTHRLSNNRIQVQLLRDIGVFDLVDTYNVTSADYEAYDKALEKGRQVQRQRQSLRLEVKELSGQIREIVQEQKVIQAKLTGLGRKAHPRKAKLKGELEQLEQQKQELKDQKQGLVDAIEQRSQAFTQARYEQVEARMRMQIMVMSEVDQRLEDIKVKALEYRYQIYRHFRNVICEGQSAVAIANKLIKRVAHELVKVGSEDAVSLYVIRYSGNEVYKDQMLKAFQAKWDQRLEKNRPVCDICNKDSDLITETEKGSEIDEIGCGSDQEIGQCDGGDVGFSVESKVILDSGY